MPDGWTIFDLRDFIKRINAEGKAVDLAPRNSIESVFVQTMRDMNADLKVRIKRRGLV